MEEGCTNVTSSTIDDGEVFIEVEISQQYNGISLAEAASALVTLQVPSKTPASVSSSKNGENEKPVINEVNSKDLRKKILEGMKSHFNTNTEEEGLSLIEQSNRRGPPLRSKSKLKQEDTANDKDTPAVAEAVVVKIEVPKNTTPTGRGRGRPSKLSKALGMPKLLLNTLKGDKVETDTTKSEKDSGSEASSERSDSATGVNSIITTRRSQRTNISRTSASDLLKGKKSTTTSATAPDIQMVKPTELPRKRGRPCKSVPRVEKIIEAPSIQVCEEIVSHVEEDVSKMEHMASLGLTIKSNQESHSDSGIKKIRVEGVYVNGDSDLMEDESFCTSVNMNQSVSSGSVELSAQFSEKRSSYGGNSLVATSLENEVEVSIVEENMKGGTISVDRNHSLSINRIDKTCYVCSCVEKRPPIATAPPTATLYCQAVDSVGGKMVGCCLVANRKRFYRPSKKIPFMILCDSHRDRIRKHFCCPGCGLFCTQGTFLQCNSIEGSIHFFHADCASQRSSQKSCLHCQQDEAISEIRLQMKTCAVPVFCNDAKLLKTIPTAKISRMPLRDEPRSQSDPACPRYISPQLVLPSGKVIDANGIPDSLNKQNLDRILQALNSISNKDSSSNMNLFMAASAGDIERVIECLRLGHNVHMMYQDQDGQTALHAAAFNGHLAVIHIILQCGATLDKLDHSQNSPLSLALIQGHNDIVKYLIQSGSSISLKGEGGMMALHLACKYGNLEACHYIITLGNNGAKFINAQDDGGWTPLVWGCEHQRLHIVKYLLQCKADPSVRDAEQNIALHWAAFSGSVDIVALLLDNGCQVNAVNVHGDTPLHTASRRDNYESVLLLITRGARLDLRNKEGNLALAVCPDKQCHSALLLALNMKLQHFTQNPSSDAEKLLSNDITRGKENNPIQCVNGFDNDDQPPTDYLYITENCFTSPLHVDRTINSLMFCKCAGDCSTNCKCSSLSFRCWYDEEGKLVPDFNFTDPPMLFECNRACDCHRASCINRLVQHGITSRLILFRVENKGWGVRTAQPIAKGSYVCEYVGEIITDFEADQREDDSYLFDLDNKDGETYCIDARRYGNIARFINHSCDPNLIPVKVYIDHQDLKFPRIAFFAARDIQTNEELSFDYGDKFWIIKYKSFTCACRSEKCKYSQLTIQKTIEDYRRCLQLQEI